MRLATGYALALGLMLMGLISLVIAVGVGVAAAFHVIEVRYGAPLAYGVVGGLFLVLGIAGLLVGRGLLKRSAPPVPRPRRQADMLKRAVAVPVAARLISTSRMARVQADPVTQALAAAAAVTLVGWIAASRFKRRSGDIRD
ncbi:hypothetical protein [Bradyrhizobium lablabi]|uniref:hypothetical protein n=1 Tax=Bradyrhizobium lablabi TaxID=722472 RepID=UPI00201385F0|nr:hypothetical protein [Bradyrhizobium lablabi]